MTDLAEAIKSLYPTAAFFCEGDTYEGITWLSEDIQKPSIEALQAEKVRLQAEFDASTYKRQRVKEYPSLGDQLDALFHAGVFPPEMAAQIQAIKDKYPKGQP